MRAHFDDFCAGQLRGNLQPGARHAHIAVQDIMNIAVLFPELPDTLSVVVAVTVGNKAADLTVLWKYREFSRIPVKNQHCVIEFYRKPAVENMCDVHINCSLPKVCDIPAAGM